MARLSLQASRSASMTPTWRPGLCWTVLSHLFDSRELAVEPRRILKRAAKRARCQARTSLCATYKCSRTGLAQGQAGEPHWTTRGRDALATGEEPPVLWKNHAAFIAILLHSGGGSEGKDRDSRRGAAMPCQKSLLCDKLCDKLWRELEFPLLR